MIAIFSNLIGDTLAETPIGPIITPISRVISKKAVEEMGKEIKKVVDGKDDEETKKRIIIYG